MADLIHTWAELRDVALALDLPKVEDAVSWGNPNLRAHGKMWCWWSPYIDAAIFKGSIEEREMLMQPDPTTFVMHDYYAKSGLILVAGGHLDRPWAEARLHRTWRDLARQKRLAAYDEKTP